MKNLILKLKPELTFNKYSFINSIKALFACCIGLFLVKIFNLAQPQWVLISIIIVMASQYRLGGAMLKGYARLFATAIGSCIAALIIFLFSDNVFVVYFLLFIFIGVFIYLASNSKDYSYSYALGAVTMVIIVVSNNPQIHSAFDRLFEIVLGVLVAILVSRFVLPIHAEKILHENISKTLELLKEIYRYSIREEKTFSIESEDQNLEEQIIQNLAAQPILLREASTESYHVRQNKFKYIIVLRLERRLLRSIYMLHLTLRVSINKFKAIVTIHEVKTLHKEIILTIQELAKQADYKKTNFPTTDLTKMYQEIISQIREVFDQYSFEDKNKIHAYLFCLGHTINLLVRLKKILVEINGKGA
jgi:uncharacterized membrane protein YgaE (UPF0421/DUF939 family)